VGARIVFALVAMLRATLVYGEVTAAQDWEPRWPAWLRRAPAVAEPQPGSQLAHAA
jgi:hypothetical protein